MEKITLRSFWTFMIACASCVITGIWLGDAAPEALFKTAATFFILGFASFLIWAPLMVYRFLNQTSKNN